MIRFGWTFRPMRSEDIPEALEIIWQHDADDYKWAKAAYAAAGIDNQFVLVRGSRVAGMTGFHRDPEADRTCWLSWTYLKSEFRGRRLGRYMLDRLLDRLKKEKARKLFVSTSDWTDRKRRQIYRNAMQLYASVGFSTELVHHDYYMPGESQIILGLRLMPAVPPQGRQAHRSGIAATDLVPIGETKDAWAVAWQRTPADQHRPDTLAEALTLARAHQARVVFIRLPSPAAAATSGPLAASGFTPAGRLTDYYADGIDDCHFRLDRK